MKSAKMHTLATLYENANIKLNLKSKWEMAKVALRQHLPLKKRLNLHVFFSCNSLQKSYRMIAWVNSTIREALKGYFKREGAL